MKVMVGEWIILNNEYIKKSKIENLEHFSYAIEISDIQNHYNNEQRIFILRKGEKIHINLNCFRLATEEEIKVGKIKSAFN
jgi:hypothetical protein